MAAPALVGSGRRAPDRVGAPRSGDVFAVIMADRRPFFLSRARLRPRTEYTDPRMRGAAGGTGEGHRVGMLTRMQWRIAIPYTLLIAACLLGLSAYLAALLGQAQVDGLRTRLMAEARLVGEVVAPTLAGGLAD